MGSYMFIINIEPMSVSFEESCTDYYNGPWLDGLA